ncbi:MAG TPA: signal peptide peptidase SppA [Myxococcaceae bacterium]|nr:signal peptide peptidase SppA [Myxococcaceae bacterium]
MSRCKSSLAAFAACVLTLSFEASSQTGGLQANAPDFSRGATLPPTSAALVDEATAPLVNPAGLGRMPGLQLFYLHERNLARNQIIDGVYLGQSFFGLIDFGFDLEWIRGTGPSRRRTSWTLAFGAEFLSLGATYHTFSSEDLNLDALSTWDIGMVSRPTRYFSLAAAIKNLDAPSHGGLGFDRQYDFALGLRPLGERYSFAVDYLLSDLPSGSNHRLQYTVQAELLKGLLVGAGLAHGFKGEDVLFQASLTLNTSHLGVTYAGGGSSAGADHIIVARLSSQRYPSIASPQRKFALVDVTDMMTKGSSSALAFLGITEVDPYLRLMRLLDGILRDPELAGLVIKIDNLTEVGLGRSEELRRTLLRMRSAGKKVIAVVLTAGDSEYLIASGADKVFAVPESTLLINGFSVSPIYLGTAMSKLGVSWEVARVGAYKNAPDFFTRSGMSPEERETINAYLDSDVSTFEAALSSTRQISPAKIKAVWSEGLVTPAKAKDLGLIDDIIMPEEIESRVRDLGPGTLYEAGYRPGLIRDDRWGDRRQIAIVPVIGTIASGRSQEDPLGLAKIAGAESVVRALRRAQDDPLVAAIVLRVDSGGGDGLASDLMYRAVLEAKKRKPVIASMGDVAASGGYYAAMGADQVFAEPTTITGSIGVFIVKPVLNPLAEKLGIHHETLKRGDLSNFLNLLDPWTPQERVAAQQWVNAFYDSFITEVSKSRKMTKEQVDAIARGRVWSGIDAKQKGLVDQMGGLLEAIDAARERARISSSEDLELTIIGEPHGLLGSLGSSDGLLSRVLGDPVPAQLPAALRQLAVEIGADQVLLLQPTVKAMMPFTLKVR